MIISHVMFIILSVCVVQVQVVHEKSTGDVYAMKVMKKSHILQQADVSKYHTCSYKEAISGSYISAKFFMSYIPRKFPQSTLPSLQSVVSSPTQGSYVCLSLGKVLVLWVL